MSDRSVFAREKTGPGQWNRFVGTTSQVALTGFPSATAIEWDDGTGLIREFTTTAPPAEGAVAITQFDYDSWSGTATTSRTFADLSVGTGLAIVAVASRGGTGSGSDMDVTAVTVGGNAATLIGKQVVTVASQSHSVAFYRAAVTSGLVDVVATFASSAIRASCAVWTVENADASTIDHDGQVASATSVSATVDVPENGACIAMAYYTDTANGASLSGVTNRFGPENVAGATTIKHLGGDALVPAGQTGRTITVSGTTAGTPATAIYAIGIGPTP